MVNYVLREPGIIINTALFTLKGRQILIQVSVSTTVSEFFHQHRFNLMSLLLVALTVCILF